jgi:predicted signal transduction protein with EAL and GGDEF domain
VTVVKYVLELFGISLDNQDDIISLGVLGLLLSMIINSILTLIHVDLSGISDIGFIMNAMNVLISTTIFFYLRGKSNINKFIVIVLNYHFFYVFLGIWAVMSFDHTMVLIYLLFILVSDLLLLNKKQYLLHGHIHLSVIIMMFIYDYFFRLDLSNQLYVYTEIIAGSMMFFILFLIIFYFNFSAEGLNTKLEKHATIDSLTEIYNRRYFRQHPNCLEKSVTDGKMNNFNLVYIDLNRFKIYK